MDKIQFILSTIPRMAEYTFPFVTSVIGVKDPQTGQHVGSGLRCMLDGRRAVVTALHVIERAHDYSGIVLSAGYGRRPYHIHGPIHFDHAGDLAVYFVPPDFPADAPEVAFWPEDRIQGNGQRLSTDYLFVHGFPQGRSQFLRLFNGVMSKSLPYGAMQRLEQLPDNMGSDHFAIEFDPAGMRSPDGAPQWT